MWTLVAMVYLAGLAGTVGVMRRDRAVGAGRMVEATWSVLWPLYWTFFMLCVYRERNRQR